MKNRHGNGRSFYGGFFVMEGDNTVGSWERAAGRQKQGWNPLLPDAEDWFS